MRYIALIAALGLAACTPETNPTDPAPVASFRQLASVSDMEAILGKTMRIDSNMVGISSDGTFAGNFGGAVLEGTWEMQDGFWCRTLLDYSGPAPTTDCQLFELKGRKLRGTRDRGNGSQFTYTIDA